jgi:hypothetical protein
MKQLSSYTFIYLFLSLGGSLGLSGSSLLLGGGSRLGLSGGSLLLSGTLGSSLASLFSDLTLLSGDGSGLLASSGSSGGVSLIKGGSLGFLLVGNFFLVFSGLLLSVFFEDLLVFSNGSSGSFPSSLLVGLVDSLSSESSISDQSLDLGGLISDGLAFLFDLSSDDESSDIIILGQSEKFSDSGGSLGSESLGLLGVSKTSNGLFTDLDDGEGNDGKIGSNDASSNGLSLSFTSSSGSVALVASLHEESDSTLDKDTLLHGETILIVTTSNFEDVSLEFITKVFTVDFLSHSSTVEGRKLLFIVDSNRLLTAG